MLTDSCCYRWQFSLQVVLTKLNVPGVFSNDEHIGCSVLIEWTGIEHVVTILQKGGETIGIAYRVKWLDELRPTEAQRPTEELEQTVAQAERSKKQQRRGHPALSATVTEVDDALLGVIKLSTGHAFRNPSHENLEVSHSHEQSIHQVTPT